MGKKEDLRRRLYEASLAMTGRTPADIKEMLKGKGKLPGIKSEGTPLVLRVLFSIVISFLIVYQAFYPFEVWKFSLSTLAILGLVLIGIGIFSYFAGGAILSFLKTIISIVAVILIVVILSFSVQALGSPNLSTALSIAYGSTVATVAFIVALSVGVCLIVIPKSSVGFIIASVVFAAILFWVVPYGLGLTKVREVYVDPLKTVKIPITGGIDVKFGTAETDYQPASTLYAGEPYEFEFILTNYYEGTVSFSITPAMLSKKNIEFTQDYTQKTSSLGAKQYYQDSVLMDPQKMTVKENNLCPYTSLQIKGVQSSSSTNISCAYDSPCEDSKYACAKTGTFECDCFDWTKATCSKDSFKVEMNVKHTGFFRSIANLSYSQNIMPPEKGFEFTQGPLSVIVEFQPNPYIAAIHQYRSDVSMYVTFRNMGGDMTIKSFDATPQNTVIHTKEGSKELVEEVGTQKISCRNINELLPGGFLPSGAEIGGKLCTFTPPIVKTTLKDLTNNQVVDMNGVTLNDIYYYCNKVKPAEEQNNPDQIWSTTWDKIYGNIKETGLCEILQQDNTGEKQTIESSLAYTQVVVELTYERNAIFVSTDITPYTRTEECLNLAGSYTTG
jgi:hypothetical protein